MANKFIDLESLFIKIEHENELFYALREGNAQIVGELIQERLWWRGTIVRAKRIGYVWGSIVGGVAILATQWHWITPFTRGLVRWFDQIMQLGS